ncbi:MAG: siroheme synthase CysG [Pseudomonadota bacterium]
MKLLPLNHRFSAKRCLVVGGGVTGSRRTKTLLDAGAVVHVVSIEVPAKLDLLDQTHLTVTNRPFNEADVHPELDLVVAATDDRELNRCIALLARMSGVLVNVVDDASLCDVTFPSVIDREPLLITVSSGSASPILSRMLRQRIDTMIPNGYGRLAHLVGRFRKRVRKAFPDTRKRAAFWEQVLQGVIAESVFSGKQDDAEHLLERAIESPDTIFRQGEVYLIGAGPGDPDLLTLRAFRLLQKADVVIHDRLVSDAILQLIDEDVERLYVGKQRSNHSVPQDGINQLLVEYAQTGKRVARLKGGDPFVFGRGGEEIEELAAHGIPFQVIPGVTAAVGCSSYAGIPLTHRDHAQSVRFVTGQTKDGKINLDWRELTVPDQTLVFYMGLNGIAEICQQLVFHGLADETPAAVVEKGTQLDQRVFTGTLASLPDIAAKAAVESPSLIIVGSVVSLHHKLAWFD